MNEFEHCPKCGTKLNYFSGLEHMPAFLYCPKCNDVGYDDLGNRVVTLE